MTIRRFDASRIGSGGQVLPFSQAVEAGGFLFVSGQVGMNERGELVDGGILVQARQSLDNVKAILLSAGYALRDVVKVSVWLDDPRDFPAFNRIYASYFGSELPARSCVKSRLMIDAKVEIDVIAYRSSHE